MPKAPTTGAFPGLDPDSIAQAQQRYLEAWAGAGQIMSDAAQMVLRCQAEMTTATMRKLWSGQAALADGRNDQLQPMQHLGRMSDLCEIAFAHYQEMAAIMLKAQTESLEVLADCATAAAADAKRAAA
ncbi:MAG: hypothetical protein WAS21_09060 [Geminicoccaceae bacterium]